MILEQVQRHVILSKMGAHFVGICPKCGGSSNTTRFVVNVARDFCQCYSCGWNADAVRFLREIEGKSCPEAHRSLGIECSNAQCPVWDKCSHGKGEYRGADSSPAQPPKKPLAAPVAVATTPAETWQEKAAKLVERAHAALLDNPDQLAYLAGRGLPREAVERYRLGYVPEDFYRERSSWGLPQELKADGKAKKLYIPQGLLIPWFNDVPHTHPTPPLEGEGIKKVHRIRIRKQTLRNDKDARYYWLPGSGNDIICLNPSARAHVVVESDLDGLLVDWLVGDLVGTVPLGSCSTHPKASAMAALEKSLRILVALDFDTPKWQEDKQQWLAPGAKACGWWSHTFPAAFKRWPVPQGKDPGEAFSAGVDVRGWIAAGLPPALRVAAVVTPDAPLPDIEDKPEAAPVVTTLTAADGREFHITDDPYSYRHLVNEGKIVFDNTEMRHVIRAVDTPEQAADFLTLKQTFPGIKVTESEDLRGQNVPSNP